MKRTMTKKELKAIQQYIEPRYKEIADARNECIRGGVRPVVLYIGDILPHKKDELWISPMGLETECKVFGMSIIIDFRVPLHKLYITGGIL